jgi:hypothetical protein
MALLESADDSGGMFSFPIDMVTLTPKLTNSSGVLDMSGTWLSLKTKWETGVSGPVSVVTGGILYFDIGDDARKSILERTQTSIKLKTNRAEVNLGCGSVLQDTLPLPQGTRSSMWIICWL